MPPFQRAPRLRSARRLAPFLFLLPFLTAAVPALSQIPGLLDGTFDGDGRMAVAFDLGGFIVDRATDAVVQPDGRIVVVGWATTSTDIDGVVARVLPDGGLDPEFSGDGRLQLPLDHGGADNDFLEAVALQNDGKIVVAGTSDQFDGDTDVVVLRLLPNGLVDPTFQGGGAAVIGFDLGGTDNDLAVDVEILPDGRIVVGGTAESTTGSDFAVARLTSTGALDTTFHGDGKVTVNEVVPGEVILGAIALQDDGAIVLAGTNIYTSGSSVCFVARLSPSGALDGDLHDDGRVDLDFGATGSDRERCLDVIVQPDGRLLFGASSTRETDDDRDFVLARLLSNGNWDSQMGTNGYVVIPFDFGTDGNEDDVFRGMVRQSDGSIVLAGTVDTGTAHRVFGLTRVDFFGSLDTGFGFGGRNTVQFNFQTVQDDDVSDVVLQPNGRIVLVGTTARNDSNLDTDFGLARFTNDLTLFVDGFESGDASAWQ